MGGVRSLRGAPLRGSRHRAGTNTWSWWNAATMLQGMFAPASAAGTAAVRPTH